MESKIEINYPSFIQPILIDSPELQSARALIWSVFFEFEGKDYDQQGLDTFQKFISTENLLSMQNSANFVMWGYYVENKLVGVIAAKDPGHLTLLFVDKNHHNRGIAKHLLQTMVNHYKHTQNKVTAVTVNSSLYAFEAYKKMGFSQVDTVKTFQGISFYPMAINI